VPHGAAFEGDVAESGKVGGIRGANVDCGRAEIEGDDPKLVERLQLAGIGDAIAVIVLPDLEFGPPQVRIRDLAVAVGIERGELAES
jgi:hypothetical protein